MLKQQLNSFKTGPMINFNFMIKVYAITNQNSCGGGFGGLGGGFGSGNGAGYGSYGGGYGSSSGGYGCF
jgi:hypothetical protein